MMDADEKQRRLKSLDRAIQRCRKCPLHQSRTHAVPGEGPVSPVVVFLGEAPGEKEDAQGRPFVGPSGAHLDRLLEAHNLTRSRIYITSCVKCRPPKNRDPRTDELQTCTQNWLHAQRAILQPRLVVLLGKVAVKHMLGKQTSLVDLHGKALIYKTQRYLVTYHPAAAMRFPRVHKDMHGDFAKLRRMMAELEGESA